MIRINRYVKENKIKIKINQGKKVSVFGLG